MKIFLIIASIFSFLSSSVFCQTCGNDLLFSHTQQEAKEREKTIKSFISQNLAQARSEITIPIVIHIVWNKVEENISDARIISQVERLNEDFNTKNKDTENVPTEFKDVIGNVGFKFCLTAFDPSGKPTTGITRTETDKVEIGTDEELYDSTKGGKTAWNTDKYLNIWVANTGKFISGFGTYPNQVAAEKVGVVINPKYFGTNDNLKFGLGRVATHEIGHFFGLKHLWGDDATCESDDEVVDTPPQKSAYSGCPSYPKSACSNSEMFMNFMDYVNDQCMFMFTEGQKKRMIANLQLFRSGLINSDLSYCLSNNNSNSYKITVIPNPSQGIFRLTFDETPMKILNYTVYNSLGMSILQEERLVNNEIDIDLTNYPNGIYFIRAGNSSSKLIKLR